MSWKEFLGIKSVPKIGVYTEQRNGIHKSFIPRFFYRPPFGYPRMQDITAIRRLARSPYVDMALTTIIDNVAAVDWEVIPEEGYGIKGVDDQGPEKEKYKGFVDPEKLQHISDFLRNPNSNDETFEEVFIERSVRDMWEIGSGTIVKVFNKKGQLVELVARDAATFTKNPDIQGMYTDREGVLGVRSNIVHDQNTAMNPWTDISPAEAREKAAYFQYGWNSGPMPIPFGRREIVWLEKKLRTYDLYPLSPVEILRQSLQTLIYSIESDLEYYTKNNMTKGILGLENTSSQEIEAFKQQWNQQIYEQDELGQFKRKQYTMPILNSVPHFTRLEFSSQEMEVIEKQRWYSKMVWAEFGVTPTELGYTEDSAGQGNQIVQSRVFRKKAVNPTLSIIQQKINREIIPEFGYENIKFRFKTFDIDEKKNEAELNKILIETGQKTVNEVRKEDGRMPVEWGDLPPSQWKEAQVQQPQKKSITTKAILSEEERTPPKIAQENAKKVLRWREEHGDEVEAMTDEGWERARQLADGGPLDIDTIKKMSQFQRHKDNSELSEEYEGEPWRDNGYVAWLGWGGDEGMKWAEKTVQKYEERKKENKALTTDTAFNIREGEEPAKFISRRVKDILSEFENRIKERLEKEMRTQNVLSDIKSANEVANNVDRYIDDEEMKRIVKESIRRVFEESHNQQSQDLQGVERPNSEMVDFLSNYAFNNIKDMNEELANDLRAELHRGILNGEGVGRMKKRVSNIFGNYRNRAETIARTESNQAAQFGKMNAVQQSEPNAKKYIIITDDNRTTRVSREMDKKYGTPEKAIPINEDFVVKVDGKEYRGKAPPFMPNDRDVLGFSFG